MGEKFSITHEVRSALSPDSALLESIKDEVLGKDYSLSLVLCDEELSQELNKKYRNKDYPTNILSFKVSEFEGEIFICIPVAEKEAEKFDRKLDNFLIFLFIHGLFHLKGMEHSSTMEEEEKKIRQQFGV